MRGASRLQGKRYVENKIHESRSYTGLGKFLAVPIYVRCWLEAGLVSTSLHQLNQTISYDTRQ